MSDQALERLEAFIGSWDIHAHFPPDHPATDLRDFKMGGRAVFEWILDGKFLVERSEVEHADAPNSYVIIAPNHNGTYTQHYFDSRGVVRTYEMTFDGTLWTLTRDKPDFSPLEFSQRWTASVEDGGKTIRGRWEICHDGTTWEHDFEMTYSKRD